jgi:hypothetical protein
MKASHFPLTNEKFSTYSFLPVPIIAKVNKKLSGNIHSTGLPFPFFRNRQ